MNERRQTDLPKQGDLKATEFSDVPSEVGASHNDNLLSDVDLQQVPKNFFGHKETSKSVAIGYSYTENDQEQLAKTECSVEKKDLTVTSHQTNVHKPTSCSINCPDCDYVGDTMKDYVRHRKNAHFFQEPGSFKCPLGEKTFPCEKNKKGRLTRQSTIGIFTCDVCGKIFNDKYKLKGHTKRLKGKCVIKSAATVPPPCYIVQPLPMNTPETPEIPKVLKCPDCDYIGKTMKQYKSHWHYVHGSHETGCFKCPVCSKIFSFKKKMKRHLARHSTTGSFPCNLCSKIYNDKKTLRRHEAIHKEGWAQKTLSCNHCSKAFLSKGGLKNHVESKHLQFEGDFLCSICGKRCRHKRWFQEHINAHLKIKPFSCEICGKAFTYSSSLNTHKLVHKEEKAFVCPVCSSAFRSKPSLAIHERIHKKAKDYGCRVCGKEFRQSAALVRHARVHTGDKPFVCEICEKRFNDSSIIRRHMILVHKQDPKHWKVNTRTEKAKNNFLSQTKTVVSETN